MINYYEYTYDKNNQIYLSNSHNYVLLEIKEYNSSKNIFIDANDVFNEIIKLGGKVFSLSNSVDVDYITLFTNLELDLANRKKLNNLYEEFRSSIELTLPESVIPYQFLSISLFIYIVFNLYKCIISMINNDDWELKSFLKLIKLADINQDIIIKYSYLYNINNKDNIKTIDNKIINLMTKLKLENEFNENIITENELLFIKSILIKIVEEIINSNISYTMTNHTPVYNYSLKSEQPFAKAYSLVGIALNKLILTLMSNNVNKYKKCVIDNCINYFKCGKGNHKQCEYHKNLKALKKRNDEKYNNSEKGKKRTEKFKNKRKIKNK